MLERGEFTRATATPPDRLTVVGVVRDGRYRWIGDAPRSCVYVPVAQTPWSHPYFFIGRNARAGASIEPDVRRTLAAFDRHLPLISLRAFSEYAAIGLAPQRIAASVAGGLGGLALALSAIGIYAMMTFSVSSRRRELAVRTALGADPAGIVRLIVGQSLRLTIVGGIAGALVGAVVASLAASLLVNISAHDPIAFGGGVALLVVVTGVAAFVPARRAARIDAAGTLRGDCIQ